MVALRAVEPDGVLGGDLDGEDLVADAAGEEGVVVQRTARLVEAALGDRVAVGDKVELDRVANRGVDVVRGERPAAVADEDDVGLTR